MTINRIFRFIDPLTDFGFKHLFGSEPNKDIMIEFLNALFEGKKRIIDLVYSPTKYSANSEEYKKVFFDLMCTGSNGEQFIIEMQRTEQAYFKDRSIYYLSRLISQQIPKGESSWNVRLKEVYLIAVLEFSLQGSNPDRYLHHIALMNTDTKKVFYDRLGFKFLELTKFDKQESELESDLDKWFYILKNMSTLDRLPGFTNKRIFEKLFKIAEVSKLTEDERRIYESNMKAKWDYENSLADGIAAGVASGVAAGIAEAVDAAVAEAVETAVAEAVETAVAEAVETAVAEAVETAVAEATAETRLEEKHATAIKLKTLGMPLSQIFEVTSLSIETIEKL